MSDKPTSNDAESSAPIGEIEHGPSKFELFLEKNLKLLILGLLLIIVAVAAFVITGQLGDAKAKEAGSALVAAETPEALRKVASDYPDSNTALSAKLLLAEELWTEGKEDEAIKLYRTVADSGEKHPAIANSQFALATVEQSKGNSEEAKALFEKVLSNNDAKYLHPISLIALGDLAKAAGEDEKAKSYYDRKLEDYPLYFDNGLTIGRKALVGVDAPERVGPPPAPAIQQGAQSSTPGIAPSIDTEVVGGDDSVDPSTSPEQPAPEPGTIDESEASEMGTSLPPGVEVDSASAEDSEANSPSEDAPAQKDEE